MRASLRVTVLGLLLALGYGCAQDGVGDRSRSDKPHEGHQSTGQLLTSAMLTDDFQLEFTVTWTGSGELKLSESDLPWGSLHSAIIVAVTDTGDVLERALPVDDPGPGIAVLQAGVPSKGRVQLLRIFPQLKRIASQSEVVLFWSYQPRERAEIGRTGGWLRVGRQ